MKIRVGQVVECYKLTKPFRGVVAEVENRLYPDCARIAHLEAQAMEWVHVNSLRVVNGPEEAAIGMLRVCDDATFGMQIQVKTVDGWKKVDSDECKLDAAAAEEEKRATDVLGMKVIMDPRARSILGTEIPFLEIKKRDHKYSSEVAVGTILYVNPCTFRFSSKISGGTKNSTYPRPGHEECTEVSGCKVTPHEPLFAAFFAEIESALHPTDKRILRGFGFRCGKTTRVKKELDEKIKHLEREIEQRKRNQNAMREYRREIRVKLDREVTRYMGFVEKTVRMCDELHELKKKREELG